MFQNTLIRNYIFQLKRRFRILQSSNFLDYRIQPTRSPLT